MLDKKAIDKIAKVYASYAIERRKLFAASDEMLAKSKQAIFALHRDDTSAAKKLLAEVEAAEKTFVTIFKEHPDLADEGPHRACLEEYAEAKLFLAFVEGKAVGAIDEIELDADTVLGGLSDCVGEMARKAVQWATQHKDKKVIEALEAAREIVAELLGMNLTGYLRTKFDQAKQSLRRIEDVAYDLSMHRGLHPSDLEKDAFGDR
jgi:predicted translin family RNA/ssDNA-binding protein